MTTWSPITPTPVGTANTFNLDDVGDLFQLDDAGDVFLLDSATAGWTPVTPQGSSWGPVPVTSVTWSAA